MKLKCKGNLTLRLAGAAAVALLAAGGVGCTTGTHPSYRTGSFEADQDISRHRYQLLTLEPRKYIERDAEVGLPVRPLRRQDTLANRAYVQGYNSSMTDWVRSHGRPGYNFAPGVPSQSEELRISEAMNDPARWLRLEGESGVLELTNGWLLRYRQRDDGLYLVWMRSGPVELDSQLSSPMVLPLEDGRLVLVQTNDKPGERAAAVLYDPQAPDSLFKLQR